MPVHHPIIGSTVFLFRKVEIFVEVLAPNYFWVEYKSLFQTSLGPVAFPNRPYVKLCDVLSKFLATFSTNQICNIDMLRYSELEKLAKTHYHLHFRSKNRHFHE